MKAIAQGYGGRHEQNRLKRTFLRLMGKKTRCLLFCVREINAFGKEKGRVLDTERCKSFQAKASN
ncbi:MAG: hypothetical protein N2327_05900 [Caldimicrobium sp.]|nr:hypothetical protein [Caldimicrobium sp.]MCX7873944.1 hypothetical protein [Caldimicrobium sp.]MDW8094217.1 hypothetical protein [Caldimicrobium sp.]